MILSAERSGSGAAASGRLRLYPTWFGNMRAKIAGSVRERKKGICRAE
jgi:hypothetical protein